MKKEKEPKKDISTVLVVLVLFTLLVISISNISIKIDFKSSCNTGEVGLNYSGRWINQTEFLNEYISINGIDNLNCDFEGSISGPWWMILGGK